MRRPPDRATRRYSRAVTIDGDPFARRTWFEPVPSPADSVCPGCHRQAAFVIWIPKLDGWLCTACHDGGQSTAEYGLVLSLIALVCIVAVLALSGQLGTLLSTVGGSI